MQAAPVRFLNAALWPATIWLSLSNLEEHPADDYVERTSPIVATAVAFWIGAIALAVLAVPSVVTIGGGFMDEDVGAIELVRRAPGVILDVLWFFVPVIYIAGFWLYASRDEAFPR
ncbi:MAG: hypothetical protein AB7O98_14430 [Hyphomonadaceae bacterium]